MAIGSVPTRRASLRKRLAGTFVLLAVLASLLQASFVWLITYRAEEQLIDRVALEQIQRSIAMYWQDPALAQPNTANMRLYVVHDGDAAAEAALPWWLRELPRAVGSYESYPFDGIEYHVAVARERDTWFYLPYDVREHEVRQHNAEAALALSVLAVGMLALLVSGGLARGMMRDLNRLAEAVTSKDSPASRFEPLAAHAETAQLASALDDYRDHLEQALERERSFSAAASHELRTPLMRAGSSLDLLREGPLDERQRASAAQVQSSLDEMAMLTGALLRTVRGHTREVATEIPIAPLVGEIAADLAGEARARRIELRLYVPAGLRLHADRSALWIVLTNLLRNAIRHSAGSSVSLRWQADALLVEDDGIGIDAARTGRTPAGSDAGGQDLGLGLTIVERICEAAGWSIAIGRRAEGGTRAELRLHGSMRGTPT
ncbi:MAG TPA: HAMP domain-containing sensor histidine kinase [Burkholderiaceae bacterium]|nr:HAMP domain-containing sensor histidine kinase [Burkholderiaceae bacterium]